MTNKCQIIGVLDNGLEGLSSTALEMLEKADVIIAATRVLSLFSTISRAAERKDLTGHLSQVPEWITAALVT